MKLLSNPNGDLDIVETGRTVAVYGAALFVVGLSLAIVGAFQTQPLPIVTTGSFFAMAGLLMAWIAEEQVTTLHADRSVTIRYERLLHRQGWVRRMRPGVVVSVDYLKGFRSGAYRHDTAFLSTTDEQIQVGSRYAYEWYWWKPGVPAFRRAEPSDSDIAIVVNRLGIPLNTFTPASDPRQYLRFLNPNDKMRPVLQRPPQRNLDAE